MPASSRAAPCSARRRTGSACSASTCGASSTARRSSRPRMIERGRPGLIINTGSKQGITTPPGDPAYNVSKAGVKAFTEALQHELRNTPGCQDQRASVDSRLRLHRPDRAGPHRETGRRLDAGADRRLHDGARSRPAISTSCAPTTTCRAPRRAAHPVGRRRHRRKPPGAVALASGLCGGVCEVREGRAMIRRPGLAPGRFVIASLARDAGTHTGFIFR